MSRHARLRRDGELEERSRLPRLPSDLTDDQAILLSLLVRVEPATAYQLAKIYRDSPVSNYGTSTGKIYPLIRRLTERGMIRARQIAGDARNSESLESTAKGRTAVRGWMMHIRPAHLLLKDPLRTMVQSFELLSRDEQLEWISNTRDALRRKLEAVEEYGASVEVPFKQFVHDNAVSSIETRLSWLERVQQGIGADRPRTGTPLARAAESRAATPLTDDEASFLSLLIRVQPATAYQLSKIYAESPVSSFGTSNGKVYPLFRRLRDRGLISSREISADARHTELLRATSKGRQAVRAWIRRSKPEHLLQSDPLRSMVQSFNLLSRNEQIEWVATAKQALAHKLSELEDYGASVRVPFKEEVHNSAVSSLQSRLAWLGRLESRLAASEKRGASA